MNKLFRNTLFLLAFFAITSCNKKEWDKYYDRPEGLGDPIYQQLQARGNFQQLTALIDKAGYKEILSTSGWWTFFAPDDAAFEAFYRENSINDISGISDSLARSIVKYSLVYNGYNKNQLGDFQTNALAEDGTGNGFKRKTTYYDWVQTGTGPYKNVIATNRNNTTKRGSSFGTTLTNVPVYVEGDNNNKYISYFTDKFFQRNSLTADDYKTFYPESSYSGFNVDRATVKEGDIAAENGYIHVVDKVIVPASSLDQYIASKPEYSEFKKLLDSLSIYVSNSYLTHRNSVLSGAQDSVYIKSYNGQLAFSPNNENYQLPGSTAFVPTLSQQKSWTLITPTNDALNNFRKKYLNKFNNSFFGATPSSVIYDFINSHMFANPVWPTMFNRLTNFQEEFATMPISDAIDKKVLSNGIFYGVKNAQDANVFRTLYGVPYLNGRYLMTYKAYSDGASGIKVALTQPDVKHVIFVTPDDVLTTLGWKYDESKATASNTAWGYKSSSDFSYSNVYKEAILRMMKTGVVPAQNNELADLSGTGIAEALSGEYIKFNNNKIQTSADFDASAVSASGLSVTKIDRVSANGTAYEIPGLLRFSEKPIGQHLENLSTAFPSVYGSFFTYLSNSSIYNKTTKAIQDLTVGATDNFTILVPNNAAIAAAVSAGLLPSSATSTNLLDKDKVRKFILFHIIRGTSIAAGSGLKTGEYLTMYQTDSGDNTFLYVENDKGAMSVVDKKTYDARRGSPTDTEWSAVNISQSNHLSNRTLIHSISKSLDYTK